MQYTLSSNTPVPNREDESLDKRPLHGQGKDIRAVVEHIERDARSRASSSTSTLPVASDQSTQHSEESTADTELCDSEHSERGLATPRDDIRDCGFLFTGATDLTEDLLADILDDFGGGGSSTDKKSETAELQSSESRLDQIATGKISAPELANDSLAQPVLGSVKEASNIPTQQQISSVIPTSAQPSGLATTTVTMQEASLTPQLEPANDKETASLSDDPVCVSNDVATKEPDASKRKANNANNVDTSEPKKKRLNEPGSSSLILLLFLKIYTFL